jgi:hypothetical protein
VNQSQIKFLDQLQQQGVVHLPSAIAPLQLKDIVAAADRCFRHIEALIHQHGADRVKYRLPDRYAYLEQSTSVSPIALDHYQTPPEADILKIFTHSLGMELVTELLGRELVCNLTKSRLAKQYALANSHALHKPNAWHQDGGLGVDFLSSQITNPPYISTAMTPLMTCWIPLVDCGSDRPCLQFIQRPHHKLLHYGYLCDRELDKLFDPQDFWVPQLKLGDMLIFLNGTLHRTYVTDAMKCDRTSIELRLMPTSQIPEWMQSDRFLSLTIN